MGFNIWEGKVVRLRQVEPTDWESFHKDGSDSEISRLNDAIYGPRSPEGTRKWTEEEASKSWDGGNFRFAIEDLEGNLVGSINTHNCDPRNGTFSYGISIFREYWKKGYATDAINIVLRYYFEELRYQKVNAQVYSFNEASIRLHQRLGFQEEGKLRNMIYTKGQYFDVFLFGMTSREF